jgi:hypothetical protein
MSRSRLPHDVQPPLYARILRLRHLTPSGFLCFIFLEGTVALGVLLALAELVSWWGVLVLPATVAVMVKLNDVVAGALTQPAPPPPRPRAAPSAAPPPVQIAAETTTRPPSVVLNRGAGAQVQRPWDECLEAQQQRVRQSAARRYE